MITNFKIFEENSENLSYPHSAKIGDIIICIKQPYSSFFQIGDKFKIIKIKQQDMMTYWFDILRLKDNQKAKGWNSNLFQPEIEHNANKYNL